MVAKTLEISAWEHGYSGATLLGRQEMHKAYDNTSWAMGHLSLEHFANEYVWAKIMDAPSTARLMRRWDKACNISEIHVVALYNGNYQVTSQTDYKIHYNVTLNGGCTCPDAEKADFGWCKHRIAAWQYERYLDQERDAYKEEMLCKQYDDREDICPPKEERSQTVA